MSDTSKDRRDFERGIHLHLEESEKKRKEWYDRVFDIAEKLHNKVEESTLRGKKDKEELLKLLMSHREKLLEIIQEAKIESKADLVKLEKDLNKVIESIKNNVGNLVTGNTELKLAIETESNVLKETFRSNIDDRLSKHIESDEKEFDKIDGRVGAIETALQTVGLSQNTLKTKLGVYVVFITVITTSIITTIAGGLLFLFKEAIKAYLGVG